MSHAFYTYHNSKSLRNTKVNYKSLNSRQNRKRNNTIQDNYKGFWNCNNFFKKQMLCMKHIKYI